MGRDGGGAGVKGVARLGSGKALPDKGIHVIPTGDSLVVELPGGGGFGDPKLRARALVEADVKAGVVSGESAKKDYFLAEVNSSTLTPPPSPPHRPASFLSPKVPRREVPLQGCEGVCRSTEAPQSLSMN